MSALGWRGAIRVYNTFDEDIAYNKSRKIPAEEPEETEVPKIHDTTMKEEIEEEDREI